MPPWNRMLREDFAALVEASRAEQVALASAPHDSLLSAPLLAEHIK